MAGLFCLSPIPTLFLIIGRSMSQYNPRLGLILALTTAIFWGALPIAIKQAVEVMDPFTLVWYRFLTAGIGLFAWLAWKKQLPKLGSFQFASLIFLILAVLGLASNFVLYNLALLYLPPSAVQVIIQLAPIMLLIVSSVIFKEKIHRYQVMGVLILLVGLGLFFNNKLSIFLNGDSTYTLGIAIAFLAAVVWVIYGLMQKKLLQHFQSAQILLMVYICCAIFLTPFAKPSQLTLMDTRQLSMLAFCCLNTLIGYGAFAEALARWEASKVSGLLTLAPLFTIVFVEAGFTFWPHLIEPVQLNLLGYIGAITVVSGAMFCALGQKFWPKRS
jgi:drug/metabolite transporter (DMT)-like permease